MKENINKKIKLSEDQLKIVNKYCCDNLKELKKICIPLIHKKYVAEMEYDDLISDAMKVLLESVQSYNVAKNNNFAAYLTTNIKRSYKDWTRDRMRDKRVNYARDRYGNIIYEEYEVHGEKKKKKVIIRSLTLDVTTEEGREIQETVASDFSIENMLMPEQKSEWHQEVKDYLHSLSPLQYKIIIMLTNKYNKEEICEILHIEMSHYDNLLRRITSDEKIKPLRTLIGGKRL